MKKIVKPNLKKPIINGSIDEWGYILNDNIDITMRFAEEAIQDLTKKDDELARLDEEKIDKTELSTFVKNTVDNYIDSEVKPDLTNTLDEHVTTVNKPDLDSYTDVKKRELDAHEKLKEGQLNTFTTQKKSQLNSYVESVNKPELTRFTEPQKPIIQGYTEEGKQDITAHTDNKKGELDSYAVDKKEEITQHTASMKQELTEKTNLDKGILDAYTTEKKGEITAHTNAKLGELDTKTEENKGILDAHEKTKEQEILSFVDTTIKPDITAHADSEKNKSTTAITSHTDAEIERLNTSIDLDKKLDKVDVIDDLTTTDPKKALSANQGNVLYNMIKAISGGAGTIDLLAKTARATGRLTYSGTLFQNTTAISVGSRLYESELFLDGTRMDDSQYNIDLSTGTITLLKPYADYNVTWVVLDKLPYRISFSFPTIQQLLLTSDRFKTSIVIGDVIEIEGENQANDGEARLVVVGDTKGLNGVELTSGKWLNEIPNTRISNKLDKGNYVGTAQDLKSLVDTKLNKGEAWYAQSPIGSIIAFPNDNIPLGWLLCNGQTISQSEYPELYALIGSKVPDFRGQFLRGNDNGRGIDSGRVILSEQEDTIRNITGTFDPSAFTDGYVFSYPPTGCFEFEAPNVGSKGFFDDATNTYSPDNVRAVKFDASRVVPTSNEVRPKNVSVNYCIKAKNVVNPSTAVDAAEELKNLLNNKIDKVLLEDEIFTKTNCPIQKTGNGWQKLPSGFIIQWVNVGNTNQKVVNFPISFPSVTISIHSTCSNPNSVPVAISTFNISNAGCTVIPFKTIDGTKQTTPVTIFAIGY